MKGNLSRGVLPGLLRELFVTHRSGLLHVTRGSERRSVHFQDGRIVGAQASDPEEQMGPVLVRQGFLSQAELDRARTEREQRVVPAPADVEARVELRPALPDQDLACVDGLSAETLDAEALGVGVATVA
jgi:hypothetical protein